MRTSYGDFFVDRRQFVSLSFFLHMDDIIKTSSSKEVVEIQNTVSSCNVPIYQLINDVCCIQNFFV